jgi:hypothetical protein
MQIEACDLVARHFCADLEEIVCVGLFQRGTRFGNAISTHAPSKTLLKSSAKADYLFSPTWRLCLHWEIVRCKRFSSDLAFR